MKTAQTKKVAGDFISFLKSTEAPGSKSESVACFDGDIPPGYEVRCNVRFASQTDKILIKKAQTVASCAALCKKYDNCKLFSFYEVLGSGNMCALSTTLTTKALASSHSFVRDISTLPEVDQCFQGSLPTGYKVHCGAKFKTSGDKIKMRKKKTLQSCATLCDAEKGCVLFSLSSKGQCFLMKTTSQRILTSNPTLYNSFEKKNADPALLADGAGGDGSSSGNTCYPGAVPAGYEVMCNIRYKLNSEKVMSKAGLDAVGCAQLCKTKATCKLFTLQPDGKCFIMSTENTQTMTGHISFKPSSGGANSPLVPPPAALVVDVVPVGADGGNTCYPGAVPAGYEVMCNIRYKLNSEKVMSKAGLDAVGCAQLCKTKATCKLFTLQPDGKCFIMSTENTKTVTGHISFKPSSGGVAPPAPVATPATSTASSSSCYLGDVLPGYGAPRCNDRFAPYTKFKQQKVENVEACAAFCDTSQPKCLSITFDTVSKNCYLSSSVSLKAGFDGHISFIRGGSVAPATPSAPIPLADFVEIHETNLFDAKPTIAVKFSIAGPFSENKIQIKLILGTTLIATKIKTMTAAEGIMIVPVSITEDVVAGQSYVLQVLVFKASDSPKLATALAKVVQPYIHGDTMAQEEGYYSETSEEVGDGTVETCKVKCDAMRACLGADLMGSLLDGKGRTCDKSGSVPMACLPNAPHFVNVAFMCDTTYRQVVATIGALETCYERCESGCMDACEANSMGLPNSAVCQKLICM